MATNMAELMVLLKDPNRASSSFTQPPGYGPAVDPNPWAQPTLIPDNGDTSAPTIVNASAAHPVNNLPAPPSFLHPANLPAVTPVPSATMLEPPMLVPSPISAPVSVLVSASVPAPTSAVPPPIIFLPTTAQESLSGPALNWFMSLQAEDIPSWTELSKKFVEQYQYNMDTPPSFLELSTMEMAEGQKFEQYATKWRSEAAKHFPPISEAQQIQMFHGTLKGAYYSHLMGHKSSFSEMIMAGKLVDLGIKLGRIEGPTKKGEGESSRKIASAATPTSGIRSKEASVNAVNAGHNSPQQYSHFHRPRHNPSIITLPFRLRPRSTGLQLRELLSQRNRPQPHRVNKAAQRKLGSVNSLRLSRRHSPTYTNSSSQANQEGPSPFVIEYVPPKANVGFVRFDVTPTPFVIEIPAREPYQNSKVPWTYERSVGNLEQQFSVMGVTHSGRVYENPEVARKGKAPTVPGVAPEASSIPQKKVPKETAPNLIAETVGSIFSNNISFSDDELPSEGYAHSRALHIVCKCNNFVVDRVMIDNGSALNVCPVSTLKQMNVDLNCIRPSKMAVRAFDGSWREVNGEIDLLVEVGPCSFSVTFQVLDIPNAFSLLLGRPLIHSAGVVPSTLHQKLKFIVEERLITVKGEEDYAIYKETVVPYISIGDDQNLPFHSFDTISVIRDYGKGQAPSPSRCTLWEDEQGHFGSSALLLFSWAATHHRRPHSNLSLRRVDLNPSEELLEESRPIYFGEGLDKDGRVLEIEESLRRLESRQLTTVELTEEINVGTEEEPRILKIGMGLDPTQRARMIEFLTDYQEVFAWSYADMPGLDPSIVKYFLPLDTKRFPPKRQHLRRQRAGLLLRRVSGEIEVYVDDMIAKSKEGKDHLVNLKRLFDRLKKYKLRLNSTKCTFGAKLGKLLGFVVSERGIKVDPDKVKAIADHLAEFPFEDDTPINSDFPDEGILQVDSEENKFAWKMYFNGAVNSTGSGIGAVLISPDGRYYPIAAKVDFPYTSNVAEYEACILVLQAAIDFKVKELEVFGDSMLIIFQMLGQWKTKDAKLVLYHEYLEELAENFEKISFIYTLRIKNQFADALATLTSM
ncbi:hypothetical protein CRG98_008677, partial [Punica granatum]